MAEAGLREAYAITEKTKRSNMISELKKKVFDELMPEKDDGTESVLLGDTFKSLEKKVVRGDLIKTKKRIDGRDLDNGPPHCCRSWCARAHPWFRPVHPW